MKKHISHSNNLKNLNLIINSDTYKLAHEDIGLLSRNEMRGVRMLLEITKPDLILEENKILSTIIIFGGASIAEESNTKKRIEHIKELIKKNHKSILLKRNLKRLENQGKFNENAVNKNTGEIKTFFNLGKKNDWKIILNHKTRNLIEKQFKNEMIELGYL